MLLIKYWFFFFLLCANWHHLLHLVFMKTAWSPNLSSLFHLLFPLSSNGTANKMNGALDHSDQPDPDAIKMFVGQIPRSWSEKELKELFEPYGAVYQINVLRDRSQNPPQSKGTVVMLSLLSVCLFSRWSCLPSAFPKRFASGLSVLYYAVLSYAAVLRGEDSWILSDIAFLLFWNWSLIVCYLEACIPTVQKIGKYHSPCLNYHCQKCGNLSSCFTGLAHEKYNFLFPFVSSLCTPGGNYFKDTEGKNDSGGFLPHHCPSSNKNYKWSPCPFSKIWFFFCSHVKGLVFGTDTVLNERVSLPSFIFLYTCKLFVPSYIPSYHYVYLCLFRHVRILCIIAV